jgi:meso-butanediol dehydrogenase/(S,S)-butanediol dehydrogenase/diacetyl reductase
LRGVRLDIAAPNDGKRPSKSLVVDRRRRGSEPRENPPLAYRARQIDRRYQSPLEGAWRDGKLDVLFNNAGVHAENYPETAASLAIDEWHRIMDVNLSGQFYCSKYALPALETSDGAIVNMSSVQGRVAARCPPYAASKAAALNLTRDMAVAFGRDGINANAICPGTVRTPNLNHLSEAEYEDLLDRVKRGDARTGLPRLGEPEDVWQLAAFLASDRAEWITGEAVTVDGSYSAHLQ